MTIVTDNWASRNPGVFVHRPKSPSEDRANDRFLEELRGILAAHRAVDSRFVDAVRKGRATPDEIGVFAADLVTLTRELPLLEGVIAAQGTWHSPPVVTLLSFSEALATGYYGFAPLPQLAGRFAAAWPVAPDIGDRLGNGTTILLSVLTQFADGGLEIGVAATCVDQHWAEVADALGEAFRTSYGLDVETTEVFDALAAFDGPRAEARWALLGELAQGGYHQHVIRRAVQESASVWRNMWDGWHPGE